jgi:hypothetical protein
LLRHAEAIDEAVAAAKIELNARTVVRAAEIHHEGGKYREAVDCWTTAARFEPQNPRIRPGIARAEARIREETDGIYDWDAIATAAFTAGSSTAFMDVANFWRKIGAQPTPTFGLLGHAVGLFTFRDLKRGEIVLVEKALVFADAHEIWRTGAVYRNPAVFAGGRYSCGIGPLCTALMGNPKRHLALRNCLSDARITRILLDLPPIPEGVFDMRAIEASANQCGGAFQHRFQRLRGECLLPHAGLWMMHPLMNHSCDPNIYEVNWGDVIVQRATRDIAAGEQLFIRYTSRPLPYKLPDGGACACPLCVRRAQLPTEKRRVQLFDEAVFKPFEAQLLRTGARPPSLELCRATCAEFSTLSPIPAELAYVLLELRKALSRAGLDSEAIDVSDRVIALLRQAPEETELLITELLANDRMRGAASNDAGIKEAVVVAKEWLGLSETVAKQFLLTPGIKARANAI